MAAVEFSAPEYRADGSFQYRKFEYNGDESDGWLVRRDGTDFLELGPGYSLLRTLYCGVCSTDLARAFLPYPLPQIIGHEVVALNEANRPVVVEINASHHARGQENDCPYCSNGLATQCPDRITLGIDRLPGGFAPYLLAPVHAIVELPATLSPLTAALTEPFAAALHGVETSPPRAGDTVAVLGPRRLGLLTLAALAGFRNARGIDFNITALVRHERLADLCRKVGADRILNVQETPAEQLDASFGIVYDTTGKPDGLNRALQLATRRVHLKSTHGRAVMGLDHLSDLVVDELALRRFCPRESLFTWPDETDERPNPNIFVAPGVPETAPEKLNRFREKTGRPAARFHFLDFSGALDLVNRAGRSRTDQERLLPGSPFPAFDLALVSSATEIDRVIRPRPDEQDRSLLRARGAMIYCPASPDGAGEFAPLATALRRGVSLDSSRCGSFARALEVLAATPDIARVLEAEMITQQFPLSEIDRAFEIAADSSRSVKVLVNTGGSRPDN